MKVRITLDIEAVPYLNWAAKNNISKEIVHRLDSTGGNQAQNWFVLERDVPIHEWTCIELFVSGKWVSYNEELLELEFGAEQEILKLYYDGQSNKE